MEHENSILLYSKYSNVCKKLTTLIVDSNVQIPIQYICIDNKDVRKRIQNSSTLKIKCVPCILMFKNGIVEQYEGTQAFILIQNMITSLTPPLPYIPQENIVSSEIPIVKKVSKKQNKKQNQKETTKLEDLSDDDDEEDENPDYEDEDDIPEPVQIKKPKKALRTNAVNEEFEDDLFIDEQPSIIDSSSKTAVKLHANKYTHDKKDIQSKAQDLAKERELSDSQFKKGGIPMDMRRP